MAKEQKTCAVIGSGIAGIAVAIRMANKGYSVSVFEANDFVGGKLSVESSKGYSFGMGPSVFTMPEYVDELFELSGKDPRNYYRYKLLDPAYRYFYEDGSVLDAHDGKEGFATYMAGNTGDSKADILAYLESSERVYHLTAEVFLHNSIHRIKNYFTRSVAKGLWNFGKIGAFKTMDSANKQAFQDPRLVQLFNRYATYNGSSPYLSPATLNLIPYVEIIRGAYYPEGGMYSIVRSLVKLAGELGVRFHLSTRVEQILIANKKVTGIRTEKESLPFDVVISNMDIYQSYHKLIPTLKKPTRILAQPKSSSGIIFYWGVKATHKELQLHNIFFSDNYPEEFEAIFKHKTIYHDPTIYLNITSKHTESDAPTGCENWFAFINVPNNEGQDWDQLIAEARSHVIAKINRMLKTDIGPLIETEIIYDPRIIESRTSSAFGAIYGNSSNNKFAAFFRHANFSKEIDNLYFCGGSVHPGASVPLCLLSAKITAGLVKK